MVGQTPWSAADAPVGLLALLFRLRDGGRPAQTRGSAPQPMPNHHHAPHILSGAFAICYPGLSRQEAIPHDDVYTAAPLHCFSVGLVDGGSGAGRYPAL